jgi:hypothetical protein
MTYRIRGCWSCGAHGPCTADCECAKCVDPWGYEIWRSDRPDQYRAWLVRQRLSEREPCDCPSCIQRRIQPRKVATEIEEIRVRLRVVAEKLRGRVFRFENILILANYKDYNPVAHSIKGTGLIVRALTPAGRVSGAPGHRFTDHNGVIRKVVTKEGPKILNLAAESPTPRGAFNPGLVRLPVGVSRESWPAAWIRKSETDAVEASDAPPWEIRP